MKKSWANLLQLLSRLTNFNSDYWIWQKHVRFQHKTGRKHILVDKLFPFLTFLLNHPPCCDKCLNRDAFPLYFHILELVYKHPYHLDIKHLQSVFPNNPYILKGQYIYRFNQRKMPVCSLASMLHLAQLTCVITPSKAKQIFDECVAGHKDGLEFSEVSDIIYPFVEEWPIVYQWVDHRGSGYHRRKMRKLSSDMRVDPEVKSVFELLENNIPFACFYTCDGDRSHVKDRFITVVQDEGDYTFHSYQANQKISDLVNMRHVWIHNNKNYIYQSDKTMKELGILPKHRLVKFYPHAVVYCGRYKDKILVLNSWGKYHYYSGFEITDIETFTSMVNTLSVYYDDILTGGTTWENVGHVYFDKKECVQGWTIPTPKTIVDSSAGDCNTM